MPFVKLNYIEIVIVLYYTINYYLKVVDLSIYVIRDIKITQVITVIS